MPCRPSSPCGCTFPAWGERGTPRATEELFEVGHSSGDHGLLLQAHHSAWPSVYLGHDPAVCAHSIGAVVTCLLGYSAQAESRAQEGIRLARAWDMPRAWRTGIGSERLRMRGIRPHYALALLA